jgi:hypothetical protein
LLQVGAVVPRIAIGHCQRVRIQILCVLAGDRERGGIDVHLPHTDSKGAPGPQREAREQRRGIMSVQPVQRATQAVVVEILGGHARSQQPLDRLGRKELRHQIQPAITEAQPVQDHRHRRRADPHPLVALHVLRIEPLRQPDLTTHPCHDTQVIQPLRHIRILFGCFAHTCLLLFVLIRLPSSIL